MTDIVPESTDYLGTGGGDWDTTGQDQSPEPVTVHIASSNAKPVRPASAEYGNCMTWAIDTLLNMGKPVQILPRRYRRTKARILLSSLGPIGAVSSLQGTVTAPAANTTILTIGVANILPGEYVITWTVSLAGTPAAPENDNFQLRIGAVTVATSSNPGAVGEFPQPNYGPVFLTGALAVSVRTGAGVGTAGAIYEVSLSLIPVVPSTGFATLVLNSKQEPLMQSLPAGMQIAAPISFDWENQQPCYAVLLPGSSGPVQVAVLDQAYEET